MSTVLVTSLGSVAGDITIKTLKRLNHRVVGTDIYPREYVPDALEVGAFYQAPYTMDVENYLTFIEDVCARERVDFVFPMTDLDIDVFNANRERLAKTGATFCMSPKSALDTIRNKKTLAEFINERCPQIKTITTLSLTECQDGTPFGYPVIVKPYDGRSSIGLYRIYNEYDWAAAMAAIEEPERYIVQPFVEGPIVMSEIVRNPESGKTVVVVREELLETSNFCAITVRMYHDEDLEARSRELAEALDIRGSVNFEWILDAEGTYHFVECNPRFSAGAEFTVMSGYELIDNHLRCFQGRDIEDYAYRHQMIIARKYEEYITKIFED